MKTATASRRAAAPVAPARLVQHLDGVARLVLGERARALPRQVQRQRRAQPLWGRLLLLGGAIVLSSSSYRTAAPPPAPHATTRALYQEP